MNSLYKILEQIRYSFKLKLPDSIKVHLVFYVDYLQKDPDNLLLGQSNPNQPMLQMNGQDEYEVQEVLVVKLTQGKLSYKVK